MMTSAQVVETSVTVTDNSPFQDYPHPDDHTTQSPKFSVALVTRKVQFQILNRLVRGRCLKDQKGTANERGR